MLMEYDTLFFQKLEKMSQNLSHAAVVIGALRVKTSFCILFEISFHSCVYTCSAEPYASINAIYL